MVGKIAIPSAARTVLLCLLAMVRSTASGAAQTFVNATLASGISIPPPTTYGGFGRGAAWADFDGDGDQDLFAPGGVGQPITLWENLGNGSFVPHPVVQGGPPREDHGCVAGDFDNDGDPDVYVCEGNLLPNRLFVNHGGFVFTEEAAQRGVAWAGDSYCASWGDFDRDGWIDLYVGDLYSAPSNPTVPPPHRLYRNLRNGTFADVTAALGAASPSNALAVLWHDFDSDGWPDLHLGNDRGNLGAPPNALLRNNHGQGFVDVAPAVHANAPIGCMGISVGDIHNDGDWDVFLTNVNTGHVLLLWSGITSAYVSTYSWFTTAQIYGLQTNQSGWGSIFFDYDHDGRLDLFVSHLPGPNRLFRGTPAGPFVDDTFLRGIDVISPGGHSCCGVDYDNDGDIDIYQPGSVTSAQLLKNTVGGGNWLEVNLVGTVSNRDAFGAVVIARGAATTRRRMKTSGEGYLSDGDKRLHFGLGTDATVDLEVRWTSGTVTQHPGVAANQVLTLTEPQFTLLGLCAPGTVSLLNFNLPQDVGKPWISGLAVDVFNETTLSDGRRLRVNLGDPLLAYTTFPGNPIYLPPVGTMGPAGASVFLTLPNLPWLTGQFFAAIAVTIDPAFPDSIRSILGPQGFYVR